MVGKTIQEAIEGLSNDNECLIFKMTDGTIFILKSGSSSGDGVLHCEELSSIPKDFREIKLHIL